MKSTLNELINNKQLATVKLSNCIGLFTKTNIAETLGISRPTLDYRLKNHSWRMRELEIIVKKFNF